MKTISIKKERKPLDLITSEDYGYAAGIIDGEGCIGAYPAHKCKFSFRVHVSVSMTTSGAINFLAETFGGYLRLETRKSKGGRPIFRWSLYSREAASFLEIIIPYLKVKKLNAIDAVSLMKLHKRRGGVGVGNGGGWINEAPKEENILERLRLAGQIKERNS